MTYIIRSQQNIVEKILRDKEGRLIRARFVVYENAGRIKARLLDWSIIETLKGSENSLLGFIKEKICISCDISHDIFRTSYFELSTIYSIGSKPRAPTFV